MCYGKTNEVRTPGVLSRFFLNQFYLIEGIKKYLFLKKLAAETHMGRLWRHLKNWGTKIKKLITFD